MSVITATAAGAPVILLVVPALIPGGVDAKYSSGTGLDRCGLQFISEHTNFDSGGGAAVAAYDGGRPARWAGSSGLCLTNPPLMALPDLDGSEPDGCRRML